MAEPFSSHSPTRRAVLAAAALAALARPARAQAAGAGIPFQLSEGLITLPGTINGHPTMLLIDTGAGAVVVDRALATSVGLGSVAGRAVGRGFTARRSGEISKPFVLGIGNATLEARRGMILDLSAVLGGKGTIPVVVGRDLFDRFAVEIDFAARRLFLHEHGTVRLEGARRENLKRLPGGTRAIRISVEDKRPIWALFDLGNGLPLSMDRKYAESAGLLRDRPVSTGLGRELAGPVTYDIFTVRKASLAGQTFPEPPVDAYQNWLRSANEPVANVGYGLISRLGRIVIDYRSDALYVFPGAAAPSPFPKNRIGLRTTPLPNGGWRVIHVAPGSPAAGVGFKMGDEIATINGKGSMSSDEHGTLAFSALGTRIVFGMADGSKRELVLAYYY